ncbi:ATP-binding protein [uncultured Megasphaera sp.]|uniref:sensor histidine kinase n=1 Tax=uncultured Megasphaera sp. TaxID=165188 RepID=UPI00265B1BEC|nr:ATP-binding protein [uncultured Megasphaera sp.]
MKRKIYISFICLGFACMVVTTLISIGVFWHSMQRQISQEMDVYTMSIATAIEQTDYPRQYLERVTEQENGRLRITWINEEGKVLFESEYKGLMENHLERPEVQGAIQNGKGTAVRNSQTLSKSLYYEAQKLPDGTILRISIERDSIYSHFLSILPIVCGLLILAAFACIKAARVLTAQLLQPLRQTVLMIQTISNTDAGSLNQVPVVDQELQPLVSKIYYQSKIIQENIHSIEQQRNIIRLMMENLQEGVIMTDHLYRILGINHCAVTILRQKDGASLVGRPLEPLIPDASWDEIHRSTHSDRVWEQKISCDDVLYLLTVQSVYKDDEFYGTMFVIDDITEQEQREQLRREFTSNVSHELKTPLTSISGFAEVLAARLFQNDDDVVHFGSLIQKEAKRLLGMIEEIMHLTRIEENRECRPQEPVYLQDIVNDIVEFMEPVLIEKKVTIRCDMEHVAFFGDKGLIREMAMNLIDNAVKYNFPGGHVYVTVKDKGRSVDFTVRDTGIGIPEDKQKRIFERFYRVDTSRSQKIGGSGLGLSIVKHIAEYHGGTISLHSKENSGTEITVHFPVYQIKET